MYIAMDKEIVKEKPEWVKIKPAELEKLVIDLYKQGNIPAKIGLILRDKHGIPKVKLLGKRISKIIKDSKIPENSEKNIVEKKIKILEEHMQKHKHDYSALRSFSKKLWIIHRLSRTQTNEK